MDYNHVHNNNNNNSNNNNIMIYDNEQINTNTFN
jgi:hypothetical protein